jgi:molybdopterin converting factor small subunit
VKECLEAVGTRFPGFSDQVFDAKGRLHRFVSLFLNGEELERVQALAQAVSDGDDVEILAAIAGG